jgi:hypothetical protein
MSATLETSPGAGAPEQSPARYATPHVWRVFQVLASLRLTVVLFSVAMGLVFFGTLAQIDKGVWTVVDDYFRSWVVWVPFQLLAEFGKKFFGVSEQATWGGSFPFPGGWLLGTAMLVNLLAAHLTRFKISWRRAGILLTHAGVILLMVGELVTGLFAVESLMTLQVGESSNFIDHSLKVELAVTDPAGRTVAIPQGMLRPGNTVSHPELPFDVEVTEFFKNTNPVGVRGGDDSDVVVSAEGVRYRAEPATEESGVKSEQRKDMPGVRLKILRKGTPEVLLERFFSLWEYRNATNRFFMVLPVSVAVDGKPYTVVLRNERIYKPYTIELLAFEHKKYAGTDTARDFASTVRLLDSETGEERQVRVWMNHPLRHRGETFFQAGTIASEKGKPDTGTVLQVVKNPGWLLPYASCIVVTLGLLVHFGMNLTKFASRRTA